MDYEDHDYDEAFIEIAEYLKKFPTYTATATNEKSSFVSQVLYNHQQLVKIIDPLKISDDSLYLAYTFTQLLNVEGFKNKTITIGIFDELREFLTNDQIIDFLSAQITEENKKLVDTLLRYNQLTSVSYQDSGLKKRDNLFLASFIEKQFFRTPRAQNCYLKKENSIPRTVHYDASEKAICVFLKNHGNQDLYKTGTSKKVTAALLIPDDRRSNPTIVAQAVNKTSSMNTDPITELTTSEISYMRDEYENIEKELSIHQLFSGNVGIWPLLSSFTYEKPSIEEGHTISKISSLMPMATSTLRQFYKKPPITTLDECNEYCSIAKQLTLGLYTIHANGYIHGDLKLGNALFTYLENDEIFAGLSDFGFSFKPEIEKNLPFPLNEGYYGSLFCTAPELFGKKTFDEDLFKVEIWALGYLFHMLFLKKDFDFGSIPSGQRNLLKDPVPNEKKINMVDLIMEEIEKPREILIKKENRSLLEDLEILTYDMMRLDPSNRLTLQEVLVRIENFEQQSTSAFSTKEEITA